MATALGTAAQRTTCKDYLPTNESKLGPKVSLDAVGRSNEGIPPHSNFDAPDTPFRDGAVTFTVDNLGRSSPPNRALSIGVKIGKAIPAYQAVVTFDYNTTIDGSKMEFRQTTERVFLNSGSSCLSVIHGDLPQNVIVQQVL